MKKGEITTDITYYGIGKLSGKSAMVQVDVEGCGHLASDYTLKNIEDGWTLLPIGGTAFTLYNWNDNGYVDMCDWGDGDGSSCELSQLTASQLYNLRKNGAFESSDIKTGDFFVLTSYTYSQTTNKKVIDKIVIVKEDGYIPLDISSEYDVRGISEDAIMLSKLNESVDDYLSKYTYWSIDSKIVSYPQVRDEAFYDVIYFDSNGKQIGDVYETGYPFFSHYAAVKKDGKWGYIDKQGNVVVDFVFDKATPIYDGEAWVIYNGKTGRLNIIDMINNNIPFTDEYLNVDAWKQDGQNRLEVIADALKKRQSASTLSDRVGRVAKGSILVYTDTIEAEGYTWYKLLDGSYIAD